MGFKVGWVELPVVQVGLRRELRVGDVMGVEREAVHRAVVVLPCGRHRAVAGSRKSSTYTLAAATQCIVIRRDHPGLARLRTLLGLDLWHVEAPGLDVVRLFHFAASHHRTNTRGGRHAAHHQARTDDPVLNEFQRVLHRDAFRAFELHIGML